MTTKKVQYWTLAALVLLAAPVACLAQTGEGYDPMLQITHQFAHPIVLIVQDVSGSMAWDKYGETPSTATGTAPAVSWSPAVGSGSCSTTTPKKCTVWSYTLTVSQQLPTRINTLKNALGNSVSIYTEWIPPAAGPAATAWAGLGTISIGTPTINHTVSPETWTVVYKLTFTSQKVAPPVPFAASGVPTFGSGGTLQGPADLVGDNAATVNWGLLTYSGNCNTSTLQVTPSTDDNNQAANVAAIETKMSNGTGGLTVTGSTPTRSALTAAGTALRNVYAADTKKNCGRIYASILVTDGLSNNCNPSNANWISPCGSCPSTSCCDVGSSGYNCPNSYTLFPAGISETNWNTIVSGANVRIRTWVIGVSDAVSPCELNFTAYMGRTDSSATDAGMDWSHNTYLPQSTGQTTRYTINATHPAYAYFATTSQALINAFSAIVAAVAAGDYTTGAPTSSSAGGSSSGTSVFLSSAEFPEWKGHLYALDVSKNPVTQPTEYYMWDAGEALTAQSSADRRIYTWNASGTLIPVNATNLLNLQAAATAFTPTFTATNLTSNVVDFIRGNNGSGTARSWKLGPVVNVTPAIVDKVEVYQQGTSQDHSGFETAHSTREPILWAGSDDGMLHAFATRNVTIGTLTYAEGAELFALLPPDLLPKQVDLYTNYDPAKSPVGQPAMPSNHIYGVANSPRFGDVWCPSPTPGAYKTVLFLTEGPGGDMLAALDVTDPVGLLQANTANLPVSLLWQKRGTSLTGLKNTWGLPAFGFSSSTVFQGVMGSGYDPVSATTTPYAYTFNPADGTFTTTGHTLTAAATSYVRNQAFADSVIFSRSAETFKSDNLVTQAIQADLHGRLWFMNSPSWTPFIGLNATTIASQPQPIYYPPTAVGITRYNVKYDVYAFATGSFYEKDPDLSGSTVGTTGFMPSIFIGIRTPQDGAAVPTSSTLRIRIKDILVKNADGTTRALGPRTQVLSSPLLVLPASGLNLNYLNAVFMLYDPDATSSCAGESFILQVKFNVTASGSILSSAAPPTNPNGSGTGTSGDPTIGTSATSVGSGASSGFTIVNNSVFVGMSGVGADAKAYAAGTDIEVNPGSRAATPNWWRELQ